MEGWKLLVMTVLFIVLAAIWSSLMFKKSVTVYPLGVGEGIESIESQVEE